MGGDGRFRWDRECDLRGEVCPYTFVKSLAILDGLRPGQVLRVVVDYPPAVESIPRTIRLHGHRALGVELLGEGIWAVYLEKAG